MSRPALRSTSVSPAIRARLAEYARLERIAAQLTAELRAGTITPEGLSLVSLVSAEGHRRQAEYRAGRAA